MDVLEQVDHRIKNRVNLRFTHEVGEGALPAIAQTFGPKNRCSIIGTDVGTDALTNLSTADTLLAS